MEHYLDLKKGIKEEKLKEAAEYIKQGGIVIFPTETVYGIGTNGLDTKAVERLYTIKQRPKDKPISLLVSSIDMVEQIAKDITDVEYKLMEAFFPGPLTIILKKKDIVPNIVTAGGDTIGIRMPAGEIARTLVQYAGVPIAAPSANISNQPSGTNIADIMQSFKGKVDYVIDEGISPIGMASTIVQVIDGIPHILRQGSITKEEIEVKLQ